MTFSHKCGLSADNKPERCAAEGLKAEQGQERKPQDAVSEEQEAHAGEKQGEADKGQLLRSLV